MKKTPLKRRVTLKTIARSVSLSKHGKSTISRPISRLKREIQEECRKAVIARDGGCILRNTIGFNFSCGPFRKDGEMILQADHLIERSNAATYADLRLIVCVCKNHHAWKSVGNNVRKAEYDEIVKKIIGPERTKIWELAEADKHRYQQRMSESDWVIQLNDLKRQNAAVDVVSYPYG